MPPRENLADYWRRIQQELFPFLAEAVGPLSERDRLFVTVLEMARLERFVLRSFGRVGRPLACRASLARAFVAKVVFEIATTTLLVERLRVDRRLRRLCGWERVGELPSEATFSRAFAGFAASTLPERAHAAVIEASQAGRLIGHIARDSTAIAVRERPPRLVRPAKPAKRQKRGRPRKSEARPAVTKPPRRLALQPTMSLEAMLADLPRACSIGTPLVSAGGGTPRDITKSGAATSCMSMLPMATSRSAACSPARTCTTAKSPFRWRRSPPAASPASLIRRLLGPDGQRLRSHRDPRAQPPGSPRSPLRGVGRNLGPWSAFRGPLIDTVARSAAQKADCEAETRARRTINLPTAEAVRFKARTASERIFGRLKDQAGGSTIRVRGPTKVMCHLMFGILVVAVDQINRLVP